MLLDPMPLNLAATNIQSADAILRDFPEIDHWAFAGPSLGGAMAAEYVKRNPEAIQSLGLWAAYPAGNTDLSVLLLDIVSLYGDIDGVSSMSEVTGAAARLPGTARFTLIPGANHTQFGTYSEGLQRGHNAAMISREEQQAQVIQGMAQLLEGIARH